MHQRVLLVLIDSQADMIDAQAHLTPPPPDIKRVMVNWKPDVCIADTLESGISQTLTATTEV